MKITKLTLDNFRGIEKLSLSPDPHLNLIVGVNGAGKSSILDAISVMLSWFIARVKNRKGKGDNISIDDIRLKSAFSSIVLDTDLAGKWTLVRRAPQNRKDLPIKTDFSEMMRFIDPLLENLEGGLENLPTLAYYQVNRSVTNIPLRVRKHKKFDVLDAYENSLTGATGFRPFFAWYKEREDLENEEFRYNKSSQEDPQLKAVRSALKHFFPEYQNVRIQRNPLAMIIEKEGQRYNLSQLSDGEKCYISLICDLSRRLAIANPSLTNPLEGNGIILIDELELHLHPHWQQEAIGKLKTIFPNCQFFITTHSPHIVSDIHPDQLTVINKGERREIGLKTFGKPVATILTDYFDLSSSRSLEVQEFFNIAVALLRNNQYDEFQKQIDLLENLLGHGDPDIISLKLEALRKRKES